MSTTDTFLASGRFCLRSFIRDSYSVVPRGVPSCNTAEPQSESVSDSHIALRKVPGHLGRKCRNVIVTSLSSSSSIFREKKLRQILFELGRECIGQRKVMCFEALKFFPCNPFFGEEKRIRICLTKQGSLRGDFSFFYFLL